MLQWTGERFLPWMKNSTIAYEHLHRYAYAAQFAERKRVLDLASGEGYGSSILARTALSVVGVDIDAGAVDHAAFKYGAHNLKFVAGSIVDIPIKENHSFDLIVCFEAIEHIAEHGALMEQVTRLLAPDGLFIVSTPNKAAYAAESTEDNPYHIKELSFEEFRALIGNHFRYAKFLGQRVHPHSNIWPLGSGPHMAHEIVMAQTDAEFEFIEDNSREPLYIIALGSNSPGDVTDLGSILVDYSNGLLNEKNRVIDELLDGRAAQEAGIEWRTGQVEDRDRTIRSLRETLAWREGQVRELEEALEKQQEIYRPVKRLANIAMRLRLEVRSFRNSFQKMQLFYRRWYESKTVLKPFTKRPDENSG